MGVSLRDINSVILDFYSELSENHGLTSEEVVKTAASVTSSMMIKLGIAAITLKNDECECKLTLEHSISKNGLDS